MGQFQIRAKICVSKRRTKILIKLKDRAILCVKSGEVMVFPTKVCRSEPISVLAVAMWQTVMPMPQRIFSSLPGQGMAFRSQRTPMGAAFPEKPLRLRMGSCHQLLQDHIAGRKVIGTITSIVVATLASPAVCPALAANLCTSHHQNLYLINDCRKVISSKGKMDMYCLYTRLSI